MYLRFRWTGEMKTEDPITEKALDEWQKLLREATPAVQTRAGIEEIVKIANDCAKGWPSSFRSAVCSEAQDLTRQERAKKTAR
jgi:hypothetical protein